jgi:hypothetical protein
LYTINKYLLTLTGVAPLLVGGLALSEHFTHAAQKPAPAPMAARPSPTALDSSVPAKPAATRKR